MQPNPGPIKNILRPADFKNRLGLCLLHFNVRSIVPKTDMINIDIITTDNNIMVLSEMEFKKLMPNCVIVIDSYNIYKSSCSSISDGDVIC